MKFKKGDLVQIKNFSGVWIIIDITETQFALKDRDDDSRFMFMERGEALKNLELWKEKVTVEDLKKHLKPGMWVRFNPASNSEWHLGYIEDIDEEGYVVIRKIPENTRYFKYNTQFYVLPDILDPEDRNALIDLALDLKDKKWFYELTKDL